MVDLKTEIARVETAIANTNSKYLKRDYQKYLKKLYRKLKASDING